MKRRETRRNAYGQIKASGQIRLRRIDGRRRIAARLSYHDF